MSSFFSFSFSWQFCFQSVCLFVCYNFSVRFLYLSTVPIFNCKIYIISLSQSLFLEFVCFCLNMYKWTNKWDWRTFIKWSYTFLLLSSWSWSEKFVHLLSIQQQLASGGIAGNSKNLSSNRIRPLILSSPSRYFQPLYLYMCIRASPHPFLSGAFSKSKFTEIFWTSMTRGPATCDRNHAWGKN